MTEQRDGRWVYIRDIQHDGYYWFRWHDLDACAQPISIQWSNGKLAVSFLETDGVTLLKDCIGEVWSIPLVRPPQLKEVET